MVGEHERCEHERCDNCGRRYSDVYWLDDELWEFIHDRAPSGLLCPPCAVRRAMLRVLELGEYPW